MGMFCRSVFVLFILAALRILISPLVSSNSSYLYCYTITLTLPLSIRSIWEKAEIEHDLPFIVPQLYIFEMIHWKPNTGHTDMGNT
jgi:hypothetical protein